MHKEQPGRKRRSIACNPHSKISSSARRSGNRTRASGGARPGTNAAASAGAMGRGHPRVGTYQAARRVPDRHVAVHRDGAGQPANAWSAPRSRVSCSTRRTNLSASRSRARRALARQMHYTDVALLSQDEVAISKILRENNQFNDRLAKVETAGTADRTLVEQIRIIAGRGDGGGGRHRQCDSRRQAWRGHRRATASPGAARQRDHRARRTPGGWAAGPDGADCATASAPPTAAH